ncbi:unnamed protein product [Diplocarpon coronariae]
MAPSSNIRDFFNAVLEMFEISFFDGRGLVFILQGLIFLLIDPYFSETVRVAISLLVVADSVNKQSNLGLIFFSMLGIFYLEVDIFRRPGGLLLALGQSWTQLKILPSVWACARNTEPDSYIYGQLLMGLLPLAAFCCTILFFNYIAAITYVLWVCMTTPLLWFIVAVTICLVKVWQEILREDMRTLRRLQVLGRAQKLLVLGAVEAFRFCMLPYHYLCRLEYYINANNHNKGLKKRQIYKYSKLNTGQIRLLTVLRRTPSSKLQCQLSHVLLSEAPPYEAISYCWGTDLPTKVISVDGKSMLVLDAVYEVLRYRYSFRHCRLLWIDSVCINQKDNAEKEEQIRLMRIVFSRAVCVMAWLGDVECAWIARSFIISLGAKVYFFGQTTQDLLQEFEGSKDIGWKYLAILLSNPWFTRSWMLQEVALAEHVQLVFGGLTLEWKHFEKALPIIGDPLLGRFLGSSDAEHPVLGPLLGAHNAIVMSAHRALVANGANITLNETLHLSLAFQATKDHDKIYSVLGLVNDGSIERIKPDYGKSVESVFTETMLLQLQSDAALASLHMAGTGNLSNLELPSWVPDWTNSNIKIWHAGHDSTYNAGTKFGPQVFIPLDGNATVIQLGGNLIDELKEVGRVGPLGGEEAGMREKDLVSGHISLQLEWLVEGKRLAHDYARNPYFVPGERYIKQPVEEAFWRTLIADKASSIIPAPAEYAEGYAAWEWFLGIAPGSEPGAVPPWQQLLLPENERVIPKRVLSERSSVSNTYLYHVGAGSLGRRIAVTKAGLLAIVPPGARKDDSVVIIWGTQTPYLLRPCEKMIAGEHCWELVGSCFVHGLMDGQGATGDGVVFNLV